MATPTYNDYLLSQGLSLDKADTWSPSQRQVYQNEYASKLADGSLVDSVKSGHKAWDITNSSVGPNEGLFGLGTTDQWGTAVGLGGLAMKAIALPGQMEYYGAQTDLAEQQLASNKQAMADKQKFNDTWAYASNSLPSQNSGLARQSFTGAAGYGTGTIGSTNPVLK